MLAKTSYKLTIPIKGIHLTSEQTVQQVNYAMILQNIIFRTTPHHMQIIFNKLYLLCNKQQPTIYRLREQEPAQHIAFII